MAVVKLDLGRTSGSGIDPLDVYQVGCIYQSFAPTSPAELFGGTWLKIEGCFLRAGNDTGTGGSDTVTLTVSQMPSHSHSSPHRYVQNVDWAQNYPGVYAFQNGYGPEQSMGSTGGSQAHSNVPKYQNVYTWWRTA